MMGMAAILSRNPPGVKAGAGGRNRGGSGTVPECRQPTPVPLWRPGRPMMWSGVPIRRQRMDSPVTRRGLMKLFSIGAVGAMVRPASAADAPAWCDPEGDPTAFGLCSDLLFPHQNDSFNAIVDKLRFGNVRYVNGDTIAHSLIAENAEEIASGQAPAVMFLSCADSRVPVELLADQPRSRLFVCRVAGPVVTDEIVASLEFSIKVLGSVFLVVLGHSDCGAVRNAIALAHGEATFPPDQFGQIGKLLEKIVPAVKIADGQPGVTPLLERATKANAILQAQTLTQLDPILRPGVASGNVGVGAAYFDIPTGAATGLAKCTLRTCLPPD